MNSKLERKRKTKDPCEGCYLHRSLCMCDLIPKLDLATRLSLVIHHKELKRTTNTGRLALKALSNSNMFVRGEQNSKLDLGDLLCDEYETLLLYPSDDAEALGPEFVKTLSKKIQIIVPDGNWRQASKVNTRYKELEGVKRVKVIREVEDKFHLRAEATENGMATLQAIAHALGAIEGEKVRDQLLEVYNQKLLRTQVARGELSNSVLNTSID